MVAGPDRAQRGPPQLEWQRGAPCRAVPYGAAGRRRAYGPVGHQVLAPTVTQRPLADYDWLGGVGVQEGALSQLAEHVEVAA